MSLIVRAARAYWLLNVDIWRGFKVMVDPWVFAGVVVLAVTVALVMTGHSDTALIVAAGNLILVPMSGALRR